MERLKPQIVFDWNTGKTFQINDNTGIYDSVLNPTGYGFPNTIAGTISAVRVIFSSYLKQQYAATDVSVIKSGVEYIAIGTGSFVFDTKTVSAGDTFIFQSDGTPTLPTTLKLNETGRFQPVTDFLPTQVVSGDFTPSLLGINSLVFPDSVYTLQMDIYTGSYQAGDITPAGTYIVHGTPGQTITTSGVTYRIGETFVKNGAFTFTGTAKVSVFINTTRDEDGNPDYVYFVLGYYAWEALLEMQMRLVNSGCKCIDRLRKNLETSWNIWDGINRPYFEIDGQIDITGAQTGLEEIVELSEQCNCP